MSVLLFSRCWAPIPGRVEAIDPDVSAEQQCSRLRASPRCEWGQLVQRLSRLWWKDKPGEPDPDAGSDGRARPRHGRPGGVWGAAGPFTALQTGLWAAESHWEEAEVGLGANNQTLKLCTEEWEGVSALF